MASVIGIAVRGGFRITSYNVCYTKLLRSFQTSTNKDGTNAESVMIAQMFVYVAPEYAAMCRLLGLEEEAKFAEAEAKKMVEKICTAGWDGEWYVRAYDDFGRITSYNVCYTKLLRLSSAGVMSCAKHFPGQRNVDIDSHFELDVIPYSVEAMMGREWIPFKAAIEAGVSIRITSYNVCYTKLLRMIASWATSARPVWQSIRSWICGSSLTKSR